MARAIDVDKLLDDITAAEGHGGMGAVIAGTLKRYVMRQPILTPPNEPERAGLYGKYTVYKNPEVFEIIPHVGLVIHTLEGDHHASPGDYIIKGVNGEFYPCKPDIFAKTYESATLTPPNEPLTLDELREMDGEPVWVQTPGIPQYGRWVIVAGIDTNDGQKTLYCQGDYTCRNYGQDWLAYRRPPEGEEDTNG